MLLSEDYYSGCHLSCHLSCRFQTIAAPNAQEHVALEESNMAVIEKMYQPLKDDKEIQGRIRGCGWWKEDDNIKSTYGARRAAYVCGPLLA